MSKVNIVYLRDAGVLYGKGLAYATPGSAGLDLRACFEGEELVIAPGARIGIPSGIAVEPLVSGVAGFVYSRSGLGAVKGLTVAQGVGVSFNLLRGWSPRRYGNFPVRNGARADSGIRARNDGVFVPYHSCDSLE